MRIPIYQVDAFTDRVFGGNPAAVCALQAWLPDPVLQRMAAENGLSETAFFAPAGDGLAIRWFTPEIEMDLCGHATLATAHVILRHWQPERRSVTFASMSGPLTVTLDGDWLWLDFPARPAERCDLPPAILEAMGVEPLEVLKARDYVLVYDSAEVIRRLQPARVILDRINLDPGGVCVTAPGKECDFVSRFFTPQARIFEDPVTGSAHCSLIPYWSRRLGKAALTAWQASERSGRLLCRDMGERVWIGGQAVTYLEGTVVVEESFDHNHQLTMILC